MRVMRTMLAIVVTINDVDDGGIWGWLGDDDDNENGIGDSGYDKWYYDDGCAENSFRWFYLTFCRVSINFIFLSLKIKCLSLLYKIHEIMNRKVISSRLTFLTSVRMMNDANSAIIWQWIFFTSYLLEPKKPLPREQWHSSMVRLIVCVHICVCMFAYLCIRVRACMCTCVCLYAQICKRTCACLSVYVSERVSMCACVCRFVSYVFERVHSCICSLFLALGWWSCVVNSGHPQA